MKLNMLLLNMLDVFFMLNILGLDASTQGFTPYVNFGYANYDKLGVTVSWCWWGWSDEDQQKGQGDGMFVCPCTIPGPGPRLVTFCWQPNIV